MHWRTRCGLEVRRNQLFKCATGSLGGVPNSRPLSLIFSLCQHKKPQAHAALALLCCSGGPKIKPAKYHCFCDCDCFLCCFVTSRAPSDEPRTEAHVGRRGEEAQHPPRRRRRARGLRGEPERPQHGAARDRAPPSRRRGAGQARQPSVAREAPQVRGPNNTQVDIDVGEFQQIPICQISGTENHISKEQPGMNSLMSSPTKMWLPVQLIWHLE